MAGLLPLCCGHSMEQRLDVCVFVCSLCQHEMTWKELRESEQPSNRVTFLSPLHPLVQLDAELRRLGAM